MSLEDRLRRIVTALPEQASVTLPVLLVKEWLEVAAEIPSPPPATTRRGPAHVGDARRALHEELAGEGIDRRRALDGVTGWPRCPQPTAHSPPQIPGLTAVVHTSTIWTIESTM
jgi:hypothetical protein